MSNLNRLLETEQKNEKAKEKYIITLDKTNLTEANQSNEDLSREVEGEDVVTINTRVWDGPNDSPKLSITKNSENKPIYKS